jgi:hypothetical protein
MAIVSERTSLSAVLRTMVVTTAVSLSEAHTQQSTSESTQAPLHANCDVCAFTHAFDSTHAREFNAQFLPTEFGPIQALNQTRQAGSGMSEVNEAESTCSSILEVNAFHSGSSFEYRSEQSTQIILCHTRRHIADIHLAEQQQMSTNEYKFLHLCWQQPAHGPLTFPLSVSKGGPGNADVTSPIGLLERAADECESPPGACPSVCSPSTELRCASGERGRCGCPSNPPLGSWPFLMLERSSRLSSIL